jgi:hypothetical protein
MKSKQFTKMRLGRFVTLAAVTAGLVVAFTGTATASTPAPDLVQRWVSSHQAQSSDLIERKVANLKASQVLAPDDMVRNIGTQTTPGYTAAGLKADGLRYQAMADTYLRSESPSSHYTTQQLHAMALRYQAMAKAYEQSTGTTTSSSGIDWSDSGIGAGVGFAIALCAGGLIVLSRRNRGQQLAV